METKFIYSGFASITHLNTRKEGPEDAKELAVDLKFKTEASKAVFQFFDPYIDTVLYDPGTGAVRNAKLGPITFDYELEHYAFQVLERMFSGAKVKKFALQPIDGHRVELAFQISFNPVGEDVALLAEFLQNDIEIKVFPIDGELYFN
ncbi:hypothetical protein [Nitrosomonas sp. Nm34]|uniref:hypothetical protein n=1 Tax=Nitrosomonas sp. Nm34 TaxID=1881055 RepID=UPI0008E718C6|nr:hypothetical protein [Nitrosomonas sp. Nm34]SFI76511.1 hypothetical protein SAMN05428978_103333 [Nitrosomonas sp. Nm34]